MVIFGFGKSAAKGIGDSVRGPCASSYTVSETGLARAENQDHVYVDDARGVYCVADGMGGGAEGGLASEIVCRDLKMLVGGAERDFDSVVAAVQKALEEANQAIYAYAKDSGLGVMGSTAAVLVLDPENPRHAAVCTVGDSRVYRIRKGMPELLTRDHRAAKGNNTLTRAVGVSEDVSTEWLEIESTSESRFVLCTDGVHDVVSAARLAVFAAAGPLPSAASRLSADIMKHGAPDNFSFVLVSV